MTPALARLNLAGREDAEAAFQRCFGATAWAARMASARPFADAAALAARADAELDALGTDDWLEAFRAHPRIGDRDAQRAKFASTATWAAGEQAGADEASEATLTALADGNAAYEARFGHIFIVCATGKSAGEMLALLGARLPNEAAAELAIAAAEQRKITHLRLEKLLSP